MGYIFDKFIKSKLRNQNNTDTINNNINVSNNNKMFFGDLYSSYTEMMADIIIYVILVCNILTILFFTLIKDVEGEIVKQQINNLLDDIFNGLKDEKTENKNTNDTNILNNTLNNKQQQQSEYIFDKLNNIKNNYKEELIKKLNDTEIDNESEKKIKENNDIIFNKSLITLGIVNGICIIILFGLWKYKKFDIIYYIKKNLILGIFVIITELIFLYIISKNYIYVDKKYIIMETIKKISN
jgi:hypothetical protein